jgi:hypothetical protein
VLNLRLCKDAILTRASLQYCLLRTDQPTYIYIDIIYLTLVTARTPDITHLYIPPVARSLVRLASRNILWSCQRVCLPVPVRPLVSVERTTAFQPLTKNKTLPLPITVRCAPRIL